MKERQIVQFLHRYRCLWVVIKILWPLAQQLESYICALLWSRADIDECVTSPCSQRCENNAGSYRCLCNAGFSLNSTTGECIGNNATRRIPWRLKQDLISHLIYPVTLETGSHLSSHLKREGRWGTTDDFATSFLPFPLFSTALWDLANSRPVHSLMLPSHLFLCLPCLLPPFTVPCKMVLARPDERETWPYHCSLRFITMVRRSSCGPIACWILARTSSLVTWSVYEMRSILR